jgi:hypothetical protein
MRSRAFDTCSCQRIPIDPYAENFIDGWPTIPHTFTIDAEGVLQDERMRDGSIEGKLKKLLAQASELQPQPQAQPAETAAAK